ncbi:MAG: iron-containing alcohol dehydrogenase [Thermoplasmata archaeon]|jgi:alcohol dehydrogenase class IV
MTGFFTSPRIAWGPGAIEQLSGLGARRAVVVVDPAVSRAGGPRRVVEELAKSETTVEVIDDLSDPDRRDELDRLAARFRGAGADWVVAVGGGRLIDAVKAARLGAERSGTGWESITPVLDLPDPPRVRCVAIPTTSGSGSEASWTADLWGPDGAPVELAHRSLTPDWALVDPTFAAALPQDLVLDGAFETLTQALEAYLSAWANPFSDAFAVDAVLTVLDRLPHALRWSDDPDARSALHFAATGAGLAASNAQRGVAHALARSLMSPTGLSYGRLLGILLPHVLEFDRPSARDRVEAITRAASRTDDRGSTPLAARLLRTLETFHFPTSLAVAGVERSQLDAARSSIVTDTLRSPAVLANPRVPTPADIERLLETAFGRPSSS